jgi:hypothetical protein
VIGTSGINWQIKFAHKFSYRKFPFIFYTHDIRSQFFASKSEAFEKIHKFEIEAEKYNFEKSDGVMHKGDPEELKYLEGRIFDKINFPELQLSFLPYCSEDFFVPINKNKLSKGDREFHLVYVGCFLVQHDKVIIPLINKLLNQKIHVHIYPSGFTLHLQKGEEEEYMKDFFSTCSNNPYFHLHDTLPPKNLISEISKYDFGIFPYISILENRIEPFFTTGNKIASYLEAGLPVIVEEHFKFLNKFLKSYKLGISYNTKNILNLNKKLKSLNYPLFQKRIEKAREDFSVEKHFKRLEDFVEKVVDKKNNSIKNSK